MSDARRPRRRRGGRPADAASPAGDAGTPADSTDFAEGAPASAADTDGGRRPLVSVRRVDRAERERRQQARQRREPDLVPRPSKMRYVLLFFAGSFVGMLAQARFSEEFLSMFSLITYAAMALGIAWMWRSWARHAMEQRHLQAQRRQRASGGRASRSGRPSSEPSPDE